MTKTKNVDPLNIKIIAWGFACANEILESFGNTVTTLSGFEAFNSHGLDELSNISDCHTLNFTIRSGFYSYNFDLDDFIRLDKFKLSPFYNMLLPLYYNIAPRSRVYTGLYPSPVTINQSLNYDILQAIKLLSLYRNLTLVFFGIHPHGGFDLCLYFVARYFGKDCIVTREHTYTDHAEFFLNSYDSRPFNPWNRSNCIKSPHSGCSKLAIRQMSVSIESSHSNSDHSRFVDRYARSTLNFKRLYIRSFDSLRRHMLLLYLNICSSLLRHSRLKLFDFIQLLCKKLFRKTLLKYSSNRDRSIKSFLNESSSNHRNRNREISGFPFTALVVNTFKRLNNYESVSRYKPTKAKIKIQQIIDRSKYALLLLHHQPESSTNIDGTAYEDQILFASFLRSLLPSEIPLLIKDVQASNSRISYEKYSDALSNLPNTYHVPYQWKTIDIIKSSEVVATVTGTAGIEALALGKPVIYGGETIWRHHPNAMYIGNFYKPQDYSDFIANTKSTLSKLDSLYEPIDTFLWNGKFNLPSNLSNAQLSNLFFRVVHSYDSTLIPCDD